MGVLIEIWTQKGIVQVPVEKLLTEEQVRMLPSGAKVRIWWGGGNGPLDTLIHNPSGFDPYTTFIGSDEKLHQGDPITPPIGINKAETKVMLLDGPR